MNVEAGTVAIQNVSVLIAIGVNRVSFYTKFYTVSPILLHYFFAVLVL